MSELKEYIIGELAAAMSDFDDWWETNKTSGDIAVHKIIARQAWNHQQALIDELEAAHRWIPVRERLPRDGHWRFYGRR